ncbi:MAG: NAD(P)H-dependent glycerol-3-phosphate dehydrogenase [Parvularculaceae bacterium]
MASRFRSVGVIGGGAWGTALASLCAGNDVDTRIWALEDETAWAINNTHTNKPYLPSVPLPKALTATTSMAEMADRDAYLVVAPAQYARQTLVSLKEFAATDAPLALCCKGIEQRSGMLMTEVLAEVWPQARPAVLSGPSFARDVAMGLPTAVTLAAADAELGRRWMETVSAPNFRPYLSGDLVGAEIGGAVKNVLAIAAGAVDGRGLGESARAAIIARGFAEFQRLGVALGAKAETMAGLSGLGDLILTATSSQSRNMSLGQELGRGRSIKDVLGERRSVTEGVATAPAVIAMAAKAGVEMPVCAAVADLVSGAKGLDEIIAALMARPLKEELR